MNQDVRANRSKWQAKAEADSNLIRL